MARARTALELATTRLLARVASVYPEGYADFCATQMCAAPEEVGLRALSRLLTCIGGSAYGPRLERLERLYHWLADAHSSG